MDLYNLVLSAKITKGEGGGGDEPTGTKEITANGTYNVKSYASAHVDVPVPSGYIKPSGTKQISSNGSYDVSNFASAAVNISPIIQSLSISENGTYSVPSGVDGYNPVTVNVSGGGGITPSGTYSITSNGIYDIVSFASVDVNVSGGGGGITVDDIAMHSISGAISGSAGIIANYAFYSQAITKANFPNAIGVSQNAFCYCMSLVTVTMPNVTTLSASVFYGCDHLATVSMPNLQQIGMGTFYGCSKIETLSLPMVSFISNNAFKSCRKLMSLYLLSTSAVELSTTAAFSSTPMHLSSYTGSFGSIYVPASLVDTYKSATNWSAFAERITAYEG